MNRIALGLASAILLAACATKPPTTEELLLGTWNCEAPVGEGVLKGVMTYAAGGGATMKLAFSGEMAGAKVEVIGDGDATWKLLEDNTRLESKIGNLNLTSVKMGEQVIAPAMAQALIGPMLAGQSAVSTINIDKANLTLTATDGTVTSCKR